MAKIIDPHILKQFKIGELMGSGSYGHVWKVQSKENGKKYALKKVFGAFRNNVDAQRTYRQVEILKQLRHENIIKLEKVLGCSKKQDLYLLFQLMQADLLAVVGSNILSISHQKYILYQMFKAISYIHQLQLIHRDLKPSNVLLDSNCLAKVCDFGLVRSLNDVEPDNQVLSEEVATKWYRAPQMLLGSRSYSFPIDMWSIGCIAAELLTGKTLFSGNSTLEQLQKIIQFSGLISQEDLQSLDSPVAECLISQIHPRIKLFSDYFSLVDPIFFPLLRGLLQFNPKKRLSAKQCLQLQIFKQCKSELVLDNSSYKPVQLILDDNFRFNIKEYRHQIYSHISKVATSKQNLHSIKSKPILSKYKSLTKIEHPRQSKSNVFKVGKEKSSLPHQSNQISKERSKNSKCQASSPKKKFYKDVEKSPAIRSLSKAKNGNAYQKSAKEIAQLLKNNSCYLANPKRQTFGKLKKVSKVVRYEKKGKN